jgi:hypothetical protein
MNKKKIVKSEGAILETGFYCLFIILKLYKNYKKVENQSKIVSQILSNRNTVKYQKSYKLAQEEVKIDEIKDFYKVKRKIVDNGELYFKRKEFQIRMFKEAVNFFMFNSSMIEILREGFIEEIYFIKFPYTLDLQEYEIDIFHRDVDRSSTKMKVNQLMNQFEHFWISMRFNYLLTSKNKIISFILTNENTYLDLSFFIVSCQQ